MTKLERKADEIITLYKEKYMEDLEKDFSIKDNDTKNLNLVIKNDTGSKILFTLSDFSEDMSTEEIVDCIHKEAQCEKSDILKEQKFCLYVCLNENVGSAAGFLYPSVIGTLEPGDYILPSSTEQCLIVKHNDLELEALLETVSEVNQTEEIADDMFLSNNVYEYVGNSEFVMH